MLGTLALVPMRKEQGQSREAPPLGLAGTDELVDDDLCPIAEIAELAFPNRQAMRFGRGESVFESHDRFFRQYRVRYRERRLAGGKMLQRDVSAPGGLVVQHGMPVEESAAPAVLAGEAHRIPLLEEARIREILGTTPIESEIARHHALTCLHDGEHARMEFPVRREGGDRLAERLQSAHVDRGLDGLGPVRAQVLAPIDGVLVADQP